MKNTKYTMAFFLILVNLFFNLIASEEKLTIRVGHFPNITHAQALIGNQLTSQGKGWFEERLGKDIIVQWFVYPAGPGAMEGIFTDALDLVYVGPGPTINAYAKSKEMCIISGSCSGGSALVVKNDGVIKTSADFKGKKIGTPEFGNTQDIAARAWLRSVGIHVTQTGGDALVVPTEPAEQLALFKRGDLDAVWTIEPWVSLLVLEGNGRVFLEESSLWPETGGKYVTAHLVSSKKFLDAHAEIIQKWVSAHIALTDWINAHRDKAKELVNQELKKEVYKALPTKILNRAWDHIELLTDPIQASLYKDAKEAYALGFLKKEPDLTGIYNLVFLEKGLKEKNHRLNKD